MEWIVTTAKTVEEAKELALDRLGVADEDAEFEILEEPRPGLFGRVRGEARVRARVRPTRPRAKVERRDRRRRERSDKATDKATDKAAAEKADKVTTRAGAPAADEQTDDGAPAPAEERLATEGAATPSRSRRGGRRTSGRTDQAAALDDAAEREDIVADDQVDEQEIADVAAAATAFVTSIVESFGVEARVTTEIRDGEVEVLVDGDDVGVLIGPRGATMTALQELTRSVAQRRLGPGSPRLLVDVGRYRQRRHEALRRFVTQVADEVRASGQAKALEPMAPADRKVIHDTINDLPGVSTISEGEEPFRRVVVVPDA